MVLNDDRRKTKYVVQVHFADKLVGGSLAVLTHDFSQYESRAIAIITAAKINLHL